uniref:MHC class I-like antigen recognition-like domain-containing protein n=1 Tax=Naja naja TaxID=35670 RepID=A0A8C6XWN0_NAJNA
MRFSVPLCSRRFRQLFPLWDPFLSPQESPLQRNSRRKDGRISVPPFLLGLPLFWVSLGILCCFHIIQKMYGCELRRDGSKGGFNQYGYKGRTFLTFDKETLTWVASDPQAQITQRRWNADAGYNQYFKSYLEKECIDWMWKYLSYGNKTLLRTGEHLDPGWTFLLYGRISLTHSAPLGPLASTWAKKPMDEEFSFQGGGIPHSLCRSFS